MAHDLDPNSCTLRNLCKIMQVNLVAHPQVKRKPEEVQQKARQDAITCHITTVKYILAIVHSCTVLGKKNQFKRQTNTRSQ